MERIDKALLFAFGLKLNESEFEEKVQEYEEKIESLEDAWYSWRTEADMYKRLYEKALEKLADTREQPLPVKKLPEVKVLPKAEVVLDEGPKQLVDINRCAAEDLIALNLAPYVAADIIANRPYTEKEDVKNVKTVTAIMYQLIQHEITVGDTAEFRKPNKEVAIPAEPVVPKININTARSTDFVKFGMNSDTATKITKARKEFGTFESVDDLLTLNVLSRVRFNKWKDKLEV
jgi:DNA uptake protein ComE-like DNA-binding protein